MKLQQRILGIPPHLSLILSLMLLTFYIVDRFNTAMAFINHPMTKNLIGALILFNLLSSVRLALLKDQTTRLARLTDAIGWGLISLVTAGFLIYDYLYPVQILFTKDSTKLLLCVLAIVSILSAVLAIICQRKAAVKEGEL